MNNYYTGTRSLRPGGSNLTIAADRVFSRLTRESSLQHVTQHGTWLVPLCIGIGWLHQPALADQQIFVPQTPLITGSEPYHLSSGDLDGDGRIDLVVANSSGSSVEVFWNDGNGEFSDPLTLQLPGAGGASLQPRWIATGDLNGDQRLDIVCALSSSSKVRVFYGLGNRQFNDVGSDVSVDSSPRSVAIADFNADGRPDLAVANYGFNGDGATTTVLLNQGGGSFTASTLSVLSAPICLAAADMDADNDMDLVVANYNSNKLTLLRNHGDGTFAPPLQLPAGAKPSSIAISDLNADGRPDIICTNSAALSGGSIGVIMNLGQNAYAAMVEYAAGTGAFSVAIADLDADGYPDIVSADYSNGGASNVSVFRNTGNGTLSPRFAVPTGMGSVALVLATLDSDHRQDIAVANRFSNSISLLYFHPSPIYVRSGADGGPGDGATWGSAFNELRDALIVGPSTLWASEIWVAKGVYKPAGLNGDRNASFQLRNNLAIYGGFAGNEPADFDLSLRNFAANETILSGDLNGDDPATDSTLQINRSDNSNHVVSAVNLGIQGAAPTAVMDGLKITGGHDPSPTGVGGGVWIDNSAVLIKNCSISGNFATWRGGGVFLNSAKLTTEDSTFLTNMAETSSGGAIFNLHSTAAIRGCTFISNSAHVHGGAVHVDPNGTLLLSGSSFTRNTTSSSGDGGAVSLYGPGETAWITNCSFMGNTSPAGFAIQVLGGSATIAGSLFVGNQSTNQVAPDNYYSNYGYGTINVDSSVSNPTTAVIADCTIAYNTSSGSDGSAGVSTWSGTTVGIQNTIVWGNSLQGNQGLLAQVRVQTGSPDSLTLGHSTLLGWPGSQDASGNNGSDPLFVLAPSRGADGVWGTSDDVGNLRLAAGSPSLDSGNNGLIPPDSADINANGNTSEYLPWDLDGSLRIQNGTVDRGCYEGYRCPGCPDDRQWFSPQSGEWTDDSRWSFSKPDACHFSIFDFAGAYLVNFASGDAARGFEQSRGQVTLAPTAGLVSATLKLGPPTSGPVCGSNIPDPTRPALGISGTPTDNPTLTLIGGTVSAQSGLIADDAGTFGTVEVSGVSSRLIVSPGTFTVGNYGTGVLAVDNGATCFANSLNIGIAFIDSSVPPDNIADRHGTVFVTGTGSTLKVPTALQVYSGELSVTSAGVVDCLSNGTMYVHTGGVVSGDGVIRGPVVNTGTVQPLPASGASSTGFASLALGDSGHGASYFQLPGDPKSSDTPGTLSVRFGPSIPGNSTSSPAADRLAVNGPANLDGSLVVGATDPSYSPAVNSQFTVLTASSLTGVFAVSRMPVLPGGKNYLVPTYSQSAGRSSGVVSVITQSLADNGNNNITLNPAASTSTNFGLPKGAVLADFDGDGFPDLAIAVPDATSPSATPGNVVILRNLGNTGPGGAWAGFAQAVTRAVGRDPRGLVAAALVSGASTDLAVCNFADNTVSVLTAINLSGGTPARQDVAVGSGPISISAGNFRGGGVMDLAVACQNSNTITILNNSGSGVFAASPGVLGTDDGPAAITNADFNSDGLPDLAVANRGSGTVTVYFNRPGTHVFPVAPDGRLLAASEPIDIQPGNIDNSKAKSIVCLNRGSGTLSFFLNSGGDGNFSPGATIPIGTAPDSFAMADLDNDGDLDIAVVVHDTPASTVVRVLRNDLTGGTLSYTVFGDQYAGQSPQLVRAGDVDHNGLNDLVAVTNPGSASRPGDSSARAINYTAKGVLSFPAPPPPCPEDLTGDRVVNTFDLAKLLSKFGQSVPAGTQGDVNGDGVVNTFDLAKLLSKFGGACP